MTRRYFESWEEAKRHSQRYCEHWQGGKSESRVGSSGSAANTNYKLTPEQRLELDAFIRRLPPDLIPYQKHIRSMTEDFIRTESSFRDSGDPYVKNFLAKQLAIEQLQVLRDHFDGLFTDKEFEACKRRGLAADGAK